MKRLIAVVIGILLSASLIASANAAPKKKISVIPKQRQVVVAPKQQQSPGVVVPRTGMANAKKVMQYRIQREKKMIEVRKQAQAQKHQARAGNLIN